MGHNFLCIYPIGRQQQRNRDEEIKGFPGEKGVRGDFGLDGEPGDAGPTLPGPTGQLGDKGADGDLGIQGPKGSKGLIGGTGMKGHKGNSLYNIKIEYFSYWNLLKINLTYTLKLRKFWWQNFPGLPDFNDFVSDAKWFGYICTEVLE